MKFESQKQFIDNFHTVIDAYCYGIGDYDGEFSDELISIIIKDIRPAIQEAIENLYKFNLLGIAEQFCKATNFRVSPEGVVATLLDLLPNPKCLSEEEQFTIAQIIDPVDQAIPGTLERIQWDWSHQQAA